MGNFYDEFHKIGFLSAIDQAFIFRSNLNNSLPSNENIGNSETESPLSALLEGLLFYILPKLAWKDINNFLISCLRLYRIISKFQTERRINYLIYNIASSLIPKERSNLKLVHGLSIERCISNIIEYDKATKISIETSFNNISGFDMEYFSILFNPETYSCEICLNDKDDKPILTHKKDRSLSYHYNECM
jgi:hypothetical protein